MSKLMPQLRPFICCRSNLGRVNCNVAVSTFIHKGHRFKFAKAKEIDIYVKFFSDFK